ncbi:b-induced zinc finger protein [Ustilago sp. UG-2017a]|nr:b-induced zinc finger protein [Ustilago sp. UG-2017a]
MDSHNATSSLFDPTQASISSSSSSSAHLIPPHVRAAMTNDWSSASPASSFLTSNNQAFGGQDQAAMAAAVASRGAMRVGYATRYATGSQQVMNGATLFANGPTGGMGNGSNINGVIRKKRRRYGPKPEPPYTCFCGKVFKRHEHMLRHRATHDDSIKYECHICGKCFRRQDVMHRHTMTHTSRSRLQSKMRTTASGASSSSNNASHAGAQRREVDGTKLEGGVRKREQEHGAYHPQHHLGGHYADMNQQGMLEDPLLRVGLTEYPATPTSVRHNEDHHIAAAQLYSACNAPRYIYPSSYPAGMQGGGEMGEMGYPPRWPEPGTAADYHNRMGSSSMSPPPSFFPSPAAGFAPVAFEPGHFGVPLSRPAFGMSTLPPGVEYESKVHAGHDAAPYAQSWHGGCSVATHGSMHMGASASECEWSEQSPSVPSTHAFASPAWSQRAELMRREGGGGSSNSTPSGLSNRQLSMDPNGARWQEHHQPQQYQHDLPLLNGGGGGDAGYPTHHRSPNHEPRRRLSTMHMQDAYPAEGHDAKAEPHGESNGIGLGLFDQSHGHELSCNGALPPIAFSNSNHSRANESGDSDRLPHHPSPHAGDSILFSSPSHYLGAGMSSMQVSQNSTNHHSSSYATESKTSLVPMPNASETFDTGSPLTEVTGNASPRSHAYGSGIGSADRVSMRRETTRRELDEKHVDGHLSDGGNGYASSTSTVGGDRGLSSRRSW